MGEGGKETTSWAIKVSTRLGRRPHQKKNKTKQKLALPFLFSFRREVGKGMMRMDERMGRGLFSNYVCANLRSVGRYGTYGMP